MKKTDQSKNWFEQPKVQFALCIILVLFIAFACYIVFFPNQKLLAGITTRARSLPTPTVVSTPTDTPSPTLVPLFPTATPIPVVSQLDATTVFNLVNDYRVAHGLSRLAWDQDMCPFANKRLAQIQTDHSHAGFEAEIGKTYCSQCQHAGENLAGDVWTNDELVQGWIHSPTHLEDIVQPDYTVTCVATDTVGDHTFAVQEFSSNY